MAPNNPDSNLSRQKITHQNTQVKLNWKVPVNIHWTVSVESPCDLALSGARDGAREHVEGPTTTTTTTTTTTNTNNNNNDNGNNSHNNIYGYNNNDNRNNSNTSNNHNKL